LACAARVLLEESGEKPGKCTLLLGGAMVRQRIVSLPHVGDQQMKGVLHRKAANILEVELHQTAFTATEVETTDGSKEQRWLISAVRLDELRSLTRHLRTQGFHVRKIIYPRLAMLAAGMNLMAGLGETEAGIVVGVEGDSVTISLVADNTLVQQTVVPGAFDVHSTMAASVLQELRGFESHWRRHSRGGKVTRVVVAGLAQSEVEQFELACHAALPSSEFQSAGGEPAIDREVARAVYLKICVSGESNSANFTLPSPPRRSVLWTVGVGALLGGVYLGMQVQDKLEATSASISARTEALRSQVGDIQSIERDLQASSRLQAEIRARSEQLEIIGSAGIDAHEWLGMAFEAFDQRAILDSLHVDDYGGMNGFELKGRVPADPMTSVSALSDLVASCEQHPGVLDVRMELPSSLKGNTSAESTLTFQVTASIGSEIEGATQ
jgi:hypothetical protein